jgi:hypothetical protein
MNRTTRQNFHTLSLNGLLLCHQRSRGGDQSAEQHEAAYC